MSESNTEIPKEFCKVSKDFITDILTTFPEYKETLHEGLIDILQENNDTAKVREVFDYVKEIYPERFFDLLYQNQEIFTDESINTKFLPNIEFAELWKQDISDKTKLVIWKYLQLLLFAVVNNESDGKSFGDTAKLFEAINEDELKNKLEETMEQMANIFDMSGDTPFTPDISNINPSDLPNPEELHSHINGMLQVENVPGASLSRRDPASSAPTDVSRADSVGDIFQNLFKNPGKLMSMIKKVGSKLDSKLKSGELKESEIMQEAMDLMEKMEKMPGMANMKNMLNQMGMPGMGKNSKVNMGAMKGKLNQNMRGAKQRERMLRKLEQRKAAKKDDQIKLLQQQLAAAKRANQNTSQTNQIVETNTKKKRRRKKKKRPNKK